MPLFYTVENYSMRGAGDRIGPEETLKSSEISFLKRFHGTSQSVQSACVAGRRWVSVDCEACTLVVRVEAEKVGFRGIGSCNGVGEVSRSSVVAVSRDSSKNKRRRKMGSPGWGYIPLLLL